jgi:hypothetical protein
MLTIREQLERWTVEEDAGNGTYRRVPLMDYVNRHVAEVSDAEVNRLRAAIQAFLTAYDTMNDWDVAHGYVINSERDALAGDWEDALANLRAVIGSEA